MFAIVLAAAAMVSCAGNANKSKAAEAVQACAEECADGKCEKPVEEQCEACKAKAAEQAEACCDKAAEACPAEAEKAE